MKTFNPLVSCVIPVYNAEKYLDQGINSLLAQTYDNLEIILVDDKSTDDSWQLCKRYAKKHPNVRVFQNSENAGGPLRGRERGIREAQGEWITFMDCDDYVEPAYIEHLVNATCNGKFDIAATGHSRLHSDGRIENFLWNDYSQTTDERLAVFYKHFLTNDFWTDPTDTVGQNLIRASICKKTDLSRYPNLVWAEDTLMALTFLANSEKGVNFVDKHDFVWRQVEGSGSHGGFSSRADQGAFYEACFDVFSQKSIYERVSLLSPLISVIIPVYNVEKYLATCVDSVLKQSYQNIEIIIINDGAVDNSQDIIDEFKKADSRVKAVKQKNQGLNMARAAGVKIARGEYITFIDSDDAVHSDYIKTLYENIIKHDIDISVVGYTNFLEDAELKKNKPKPRSENRVLKNRHEIMSYFLGQSPTFSNVYPVTAWGKLYIARIIKNTDWNFSNYRRNEDNFELLQWYMASERGVAISPTPLYCYRKNPNSITFTNQLNINPDGQEINYFEYLDELYEKTKKYINDDSLEMAILSYFANTNSVQLRNFALSRQLSAREIDSAANNIAKIINLYNQAIERQQLSNSELNDTVKLMSGSISWKITKPIRASKRIYRKFRRMGISAWYSGRH